MVALAESLTCRRRVLLGYFGETLGEDCGNCDICLNPPETFDATVPAQKVLSCIYRSGSASVCVTSSTCCAVPTPSASAAWVTTACPPTTSARISAPRNGPPSSASSSTCGLVSQDIAQYSVLKLTPEARPILRGEESLILAKPRIREKTARKETPRSAEALTADDLGLFEALRELRKDLADEAGVPPYVVFGDATLVQMAQERPASDAALLAITGRGPEETRALRRRVPRRHRPLLIRHRSRSAGPVHAVATCPAGPRHREPHDRGRRVQAAPRLLHRISLSASW